MVYKFLHKKSSESGVNEPNYQLVNKLLINQLLKILKNEKFIHHLETIFGGLI